MLLALTAADGTPLMARHWPAAAQPGLASGHPPTLLLVHGLGEHAGRYNALAQDLNAAGWDVWAYDQRGHGESGGARGALPHAQALLEDLAGVIDAVRSRSAGAPLVLLGHSLGGLLAARFVAESAVGRKVASAATQAAKPAAQHGETPVAAQLAESPAPAALAAWSRPVDALVLSSPALVLRMSALQKLLLKLGALTPNQGAHNGLKPHWISRDRAVVAAYKADPLVHARITPRLAQWMLTAGQRTLALAPGWSTPTLLLWAGADRCVAAEGSERFAALAPKGLVQAQCFAALYHEIFNEPERQQVVAALLAWLAARFGTAPPGPNPM